MTKSSDNILNKNFVFSRALKGIDSSLKFDKMQEGRTLYVLNKMRRDERRKMLLFQKKYNHREILYNLKRAYDDNKLILERSYNNEIHKGIEKLPNLPNKDKSLIEINKQNVLNINDNNSPDNNNNKTGIFENDWKREFLMKNKNNKINIKKISPHIVPDNDEENEEDIFKKEYKQEKPKIFEKIKILKRIKENNLRVIKKLKNFRTIKEKFSEKKEYTPNYSALERHIPEVKLDTKSKRLFPDHFIKMHNYSNEKEIFMKRIFKNNSYQNENKINNNFNYSINPCSLFRKEASIQPANNDVTIYKALSKSKIIKENPNNSIFKTVLKNKN